MARKINGTPIVRNLVLVACGLIVLVFVVNIALNAMTRHGQVREVPDFSGMTVAEAENAGSSSRLNIEVNDSLYLPLYEGGVILEQSPSPGAKVKSGRRIFVTINSYNQRKAVIPYVAGYSLRQAKNNLEVAGFQIDKLIYRSDIATNNVLEQMYNSRRITATGSVEAEIGSGVTLVVGLSPEAGLQTVPRVAGFPLREAKSRLWEAGFNIGRISRDEDVTTLNEREAKVYIQSPGAGAHVSYGSEVGVSLTFDDQKVTKGIADAEKSMREAAAAARAVQEAAEAEAGPGITIEPAAELQTEQE